MAETTAMISTTGCPTATKFSGDQDDWAVWKIQIRAILGYLGLGGTLKASYKDLLPVSEDTYELLDNTDAADKKLIVAFRKNLKAITMIQACMEDRNMQQFVLSGIEESLPGFPCGLAYKVWAALVRKFEPSDLFAQQTLEAKLSSITLGPTEDPDNVKLQIEDAYPQ